MRRGWAVLALSALSSSGCAWLLGQGEVPQPAAPVRVAERAQAAQAGPLKLEVSFLGVGDRIATATNLVGRVARAVNPYGEDTFVFRLTAANSGDEPVVLLPQKATLAYGEGTVEHARTLDDYRKRWPAWAVTNDQEGEDQAAAYANVLGSLLIERQVPPGDSTEGRLAFPAHPAKDALTLRLPCAIGRKELVATLRWTL